MYSQITAVELNRLASLKASGLITQVYLALCQHDWGKGSCFPSLKTISKALSHAYHHKSIERALRWLETNLFIQRKEATSKSRFVMLLRKVKDVGTKWFQRESNGSHKKERKKKKITSSKQRDKNKDYQIKKKIADWVEAVSQVKDLRDMRNNPEYAHLLDNWGYTEASYQYPPKPQGKWHIEDVRQAFLNTHRGKPENHWIFQYYMEHYGANSLQNM